MKLLIVGIIVAMIIAVPFLLIWSLNTLFQLQIIYTLETWAATLFLSAPFVGSSARKR